MVENWRGKAAGGDRISVDLLKDGGGVTLENAAKPFSDCLRTLKLPIAWKNPNIILMHKKEHRVTPKITYSSAVWCTSNSPK